MYRACCCSSSRMNCARHRAKASGNRAAASDVRSRSAAGDDGRRSAARCRRRSFVPRRSTVFPPSADVVTVEVPNDDANRVAGVRTRWNVIGCEWWATDAGSVTRRNETRAALASIEGRTVSNPTRERGKPQPQVIDRPRNRPTGDGSCIATWLGGRVTINAIRKMPDTKTTRRETSSSRGCGAALGAGRSVCHRI